MGFEIGKIYGQLRMALQISYKPILANSTNERSSSFYISIFPLSFISWEFFMHCNDYSFKREDFFALWDYVDILDWSTIGNCCNVLVKLVGMGGQNKIMVSRCFPSFQCLIYHGIWDS